MSLTPEQAAEFCTPDNHIEAVKSLAEKVSTTDFISSCIVDDWGRFSNFSLIVHVNKETFSENKGVLTRKINAIFDQLLKKTGAHRRETFSPVANYRWCSYEMKQILDGYDKNYWMIDIDFHRFDASSNSFDDKQIRASNKK